jgi:Family of unknown function (DUF6283)
MTAIRSEPCSSCPYRRDVPSGVWAEDTYDQLLPYDEPTAKQPMRLFSCHTTPDHVCHGWAVCGTKQDHEHDLLALRAWPIEGEIPEERVPLFDSHTEAAEHGKRDIEHPSEEAVALVGRLQAKYERLR